MSRGSPFRQFLSGDVISTIQEALRHVGYEIPADCKSVSVDSETAPTYIRVDGVKHILKDEDRELVLRAIQLHRVRHRVGNSAKR